MIGNRTYPAPKHKQIEKGEVLAATVAYSERNVLDFTIECVASWICYRLIFQCIRSKPVFSLGTKDERKIIRAAQKPNR